MADPAQPITIPQRSLFKAAEVCDLVHVQPYVLRSWEAEFPELGVSKSGGPRVYRRADVERVVRIKHLLLVEGLTLAGVRRRLDEESAPVITEAPELDALFDKNARERLSAVKRGLRSILQLLSGEPQEFRLSPLSAASASSSSSRGKSNGRKPAPPPRGRRPPSRRRSA